MFALKLNLCCRNANGKNNEALRKKITTIAYKQQARKRAINRDRDMWCKPIADVQKKKNYNKTFHSKSQSTGSGTICVFDNT